MKLFTELFTVVHLCQQYFFTCRPLLKVQRLVGVCSTVFFVQHQNMCACINFWVYIVAANFNVGSS